MAHNGGEGVGMKRWRIEATQNLPEIDFDFARSRFLVAGESSPADARGFYGPLLERLQRHLAAPPDGDTVFTFDLIYINSGTAKMLMDLFDLIEEAAVRGRCVTVNWRHDPTDDQMRALGEELADELIRVRFILVAGDT